MTDVAVKHDFSEFLEVTFGKLNINESQYLLALFGLLADIETGSLFNNPEFDQTTIPDFIADEEQLAEIIQLVHSRWASVHYKIDQLSRSIHGTHAVGHKIIGRGNTDRGLAILDQIKQKQTEQDVFLEEKKELEMVLDLLWRLAETE